MREERYDHKTGICEGRKVRVVFELPAHLWADQVFVVGDFNDWNRYSLTMQQEQNGTWRLEIDPSSGQSYQFRYWVDGRWLTEQHAGKVVTNALQIYSSL